VQKGKDKKYEYCNGCKYQRGLRCMYLIMNQVDWHGMSKARFPKFILARTGECSYRRLSDGTEPNDQR
jgi:hypothetical protein